MNLSLKLKDELTVNGADIVGIGSLSEIPADARNDMPYGIVVAVAYERDIIKGIKEAPTMEYFNAYHKINDKLNQLVTHGTEYLKSLGYDAYAQTVSEVANRETMYSSILPHKTVATRSGIGWIGKCALLITKEFGSAIRISTFLTNAPLEVGSPVNESLCGDCMNCVKACPAGAVTGTNWSVSVRREEIYDPAKCRKTARELSKQLLNKDVSLCGQCIAVCPYTLKYLNEAR